MFLLLFKLLRGGNCKLRSYLASLFWVFTAGEGVEEWRLGGGKKGKAAFIALLDIMYIIGLRFKG